jgi:hypothetical protein
MRELLVIPSHPGVDLLLRLFKGLKLVLPDTLFFEAVKEPLNQTIITSKDRSERNRAEGAEASQTDRFEYPFRLLRAASQGELIPNNLANHGI